MHVVSVFSFIDFREDSQGQEKRKEVVADSNSCPFFSFFFSFCFNLQKDSKTGKCASDYDPSVLPKSFFLNF